jgi:transcriptional regulator
LGEELKVFTTDFMKAIQVLMTQEAGRKQYEIAEVLKLSESTTHH